MGGILRQYYTVILQTSKPRYHIIYVQHIKVECLGCQSSHQTTICPSFLLHFLIFLDILSEVIEAAGFVRSRGFVCGVLVVLLRMVFVVEEFVHEGGLVLILRFLLLLLGLFFCGMGVSESLGFLWDLHGSAGSASTIRDVVKMGDGRLTYLLALLRVPWFCGS